MNGAQRHAQRIQPHLVASALGLSDILSQALLNGKRLSRLCHISAPSLLHWLCLRCVKYSIPALFAQCPVSPRVSHRIEIRLPCRVRTSVIMQNLLVDVCGTMTEGWRIVCGIREENASHPGHERSLTWTILSPWDAASGWGTCASGSLGWQAA